MPSTLYIYRHVYAGKERRFRNHSLCRRDVKHCFRKRALYGWERTGRLINPTTYVCIKAETQTIEVAAGSPRFENVNLRLVDMLYNWLRIIVKIIVEHATFDHNPLNVTHFDLWHKYEWVKSSHLYEEDQHV